MSSDAQAAAAYQPGPNAAPRDAALSRAIAEALADASGGPAGRTALRAPDGRPAYVNRLILESSPYLRQHAHNPVDWRAWGPQALAEAAAADRPIFFSAGYATCHWCHVMEHESFDDPEVAAALNARFVPVKLDREELPDIDQIYMTAAMFVTRRGGWPNSVWMTPDGRPFFAGSYYPKPQFLTALGAIADTWRDRREEVERQATELADAIRAFQRADEGQGAVGQETAEAAVSQLAGVFNTAEAGFSQATQFPNETLLLLLLDTWRRDGTQPAMTMAVSTLAAIEAGGIHDHVGGGFHRYSVDVNWRTPHFEKMLYNQGLLLRCLNEAAQAPEAMVGVGAERFARAARRLSDYVVRDMTAHDGAFFAAEDADSANVQTGALEEGAFYVWDAASARAALPGEMGDFAVQALGLDAPATLENGKVAHFPRGMAIDTARIDAVLERLRAAREARPRPLRDEKIIAGWNGLLIRALAEAAPVIGPSALKAAQRAAEAVWARLWRGERLARISIDGPAQIASPEGRLDDYAWMGLGALALSDALWEAGAPAADVGLWRARAETLADAMLARFADPSGRLRLSAEDGPLGPVFETDDGATPAGDSSALELLAKLDRRSEDPRFAAAARRLLGAISKRMAERPTERSTALVGARILAEGESDLRRTVSRGAARLVVSPTQDGAVRVRALLAKGWSAQEMTARWSGGETPLRPNAEQVLALGEAEVMHISMQLCEGDRCLPPETALFRVG